MCIYKTKQINYIMFVYLFNALVFNAVYNACLLNAVNFLFKAICLYNAYLFFAIDFCKCFLFSCFVFGLLTKFAYLECYFALCTVLLIIWFT